MERAVVGYILVVAILNLTVGFALAVYLGRHGPCEKDEGLVSLQVPPAVPGLAAEPGGQPEIAPAPPAESLEPRPSDPPAAESGRSVEATLEEFQGQMEQYQGLLASLDERLREAEADPNEVTTCLDSLRQANHEYGGWHTQVREAFDQLGDKPSESRAACDGVQAAMDRHADEIARASQALDGVDSQADLQDGRRQVAEETSRLLGTSEQLRDVLDETRVTTARKRSQLASLDPANLKDELTGLMNRAGLEFALAQRWEEAPKRTRNFAAALIDLDGFSLINQQHGHKSGNRVLGAVAQMLATECAEGVIVARYSGQRFFLGFGNEDIRAATGVVERIRQLLERARLQEGNQEFRVTVSCAVTEANDQDTPDSLCQRMETTLQEAKRYGRNRTFLHEGKYPTPVVPPNFALDERHIVI